MQRIHEVEVPNSESSNSASEKELLLDAYEKELTRVQNISFKNLLWVFLLMGLSLAFILPKIYFSNQIYYTSKEINRLYHTYTALREENAHLKRELELVHYKMEVLDEME